MKLPDKLRDPAVRFRAPVACGIADTEYGPRVQIDGVDYGAGLIRNAAVVTRGEALGHGYWIDGEMLDQVAAAVNESPNGVKSRFAHPSLSGDGIGKALGRYRSAIREGDVVRADLHFFETAHKTTDGDLADYVLGLAREDPAAFGNSIAFDLDIGAMDRFRAEHEDDKGVFHSPDEDNASNYEHVRLNELMAVDVVDEPAANPEGMFYRGDGNRIVREASQLLGYAFGIQKDAPAVSWLSIAPERIRDFVARFMQEEELAVVTAAEFKRLRRLEKMLTTDRKCRRLR